jgi:hypothetical protein
MVVVDARNLVRGRRQWQIIDVAPRIARTSNWMPPEGSRGGAAERRPWPSPPNTVGSSTAATSAMLPELINSSASSAASAGQRHARTLRHAYQEFSERFQSGPTTGAVVNSAGMRVDDSTMRLTTLRRRVYRFALSAIGWLQLSSHAAC